MTFLLPAAASLAGAGAGAAATGVGVSSALALGSGISGLGTLAGFNISSLLGGASTALSGLGSIQSALYAQALAKENARRAEESARIEADRGQLAQQDADYLARIALGEEIAQQAASGFDLSSPSYATARKRNQIVARTNAERIREDSELTVRNLLSGASDALSAAQQARSSALFAGLGTLFNFGSTFITDGTTTTRRKLQSLRLA